MRKHNWKRLLIVVLALAIVATMTVGLVACNNGGGDDGGDGNKVDKGTQITPSAFFKNLWDSSKHIGAEPLTDSDDLKIDLDLCVSAGSMISEYDKQENVVKEEKGGVKIGINFSIILDRIAEAAPAAEGATAEDGTRSAARIRLYNASKSPTDKDYGIMTVYYFLDESDTAYIDFQGQQIKFRFDTGYNTADPTKYADEFNKFLDETIKGLNVSVNSIIDAVISGNGKDWTLDVPVNAIAGLFNLIETIEPLLDDFLPTLSGAGIKIKKEDIIKEVNGKKMLAVGDLLQSDLLGVVFDSPNTLSKKGEAGLVSYTTSLSTSIAGMIGGFDGVPSIVGTIFNNGILMFNYDTINDKIDNFAIRLELEKLKNGSAGLFPFVEIKINELSIAKTENLDSGRETALGITKNDFKDTFDLGIDVNLDVAGLKLNPSALGAGTDYPIDLTGNFSLELNANLDLYNKNTADAPNNNKTKLYGALKEGNDKIAEISLENGKLVLKVNNAVTDGATPYTKAVFEMFGKLMIDKFASSDNNDFKLVAVALAQGLFKATPVAPADTTGYNTVTAVVNTAQPAGTTFYYKAEYNPDFKGVILDDIDVVGLFQKLISIKPGNGGDPVNPDNPPAPSDVFGGYYKPLDDKGQEEAYYLSAKENALPISIGIDNILKKLTMLVNFSSTGDSVTIRLSKLSDVVNYIDGGSVKTYKDASGDEGDTVKRTGITDLESLYAYMFTRDQSLVKAFTDMGLIDRYVVDNQSYYKSVNMLTKKDMLNIFNCISGVYKYSSDNAKDTTYSSLVIAAGRTPASEAEYNQVVQSYAPYKIFKLLEGNDFAKLENLETKNYKGLITKLFSANVELKIEFGDGIGISASLKLDDNTSVGFGIKLDVAAGSVPAGSIEGVPTTGLNIGYNDEGAAKGWVYLSAKG